MNLFDPHDCRVARDLVVKGLDLDAVRLLSQSRDRDHRAARQLLAECQPRLIQHATQATDALLWDQAVELLEAAALCGELPVAAVALKERVLGGQRRAHEQAQRLEQARDWAAQGRVVSALDLLRPEGKHRERSGRMGAAMGKPSGSCQQDTADRAERDRSGVGVEKIKRVPGRIKQRQQSDAEQRGPNSPAPQTHPGRFSASNRSLAAVPLGRFVVPLASCRRIEETLAVTLGVQFSCRGS